MTSPESKTGTCPASPERVLELYFLEHRAKLLDIAAFLDRYQRAGGDPTADHRMRALIEAIKLLDDQPERTRRIQELLSDATTEPIDKAPMQGATGAPLDNLSQLR